MAPREETAGTTVGTLEEEIKELISNKGMKVAEFARKAGVPEHTLYSALRNGLAGSTLPTVVPIAEALGIDPVEIYHGRVTPKGGNSRSATVPFLDGAGDDDFPIPEDLHERYPGSFMLRVKGESMNRVLPGGSYALVDPCDAVEQTDRLYALSVDGGAATVRRVRVLGNGLELKPESDDPTFHAIICDNADADAPDVRIMGRVVWYCLSID